MNEEDGLTPFRQIMKDRDLDTVKDEDFDDDLRYNRKWEIFNNFVIRRSTKNENKFLFYLKTENGLKYERSLIFKGTFNYEDVYYDTERKKRVKRTNSAYVLALREWLIREKIIPEQQWRGSHKKSCCRYRKIKIKMPDKINLVVRYIEYQTRVGIRQWSPSKFIKVKVGKKVVIKPKRKAKLIRRLAISGANKRKLAEYFYLSYSRVIAITRGIKQKRKYNPAKGYKC